MASPRIQLERLTREDQTLRYEFSSTLPYFRRNDFFIRYEGLPPDCPQSLQSVPFAALMAPIAAASGAELILPSLDAEFAGAIYDVRAHWAKTFPNWAVDRFRLTAQLVRNDASAPEGSTAMLFSGGLDSLSVYIQNRDAKPHLFAIFGADIPLDRKEFIDDCRSKLFDPFAAAEKVGITYLFSNIREALRERKLQHFAANWYATAQFGLLLTGMTAPVCHGRFKKLVLASCSHREDDPMPCAADPAIIRNVRWSTTRVEDHLHDVRRVQKVSGYLAKRPEMLQYLRVCWEQFDRLNCGKCKKCLRTICELLVGGVDPAQANFHIDDRTLPELKRRLMDEFHVFFKCDTAALNFWREIQDAIVPSLLNDRYGSREFFLWMSGYERLRRNESPALCRFRYILERMRMATPQKVFRRIKWLLSERSA
jgi:hypothetical protein